MKTQLFSIALTLLLSAPAAAQHMHGEHHQHHQADTAAGHQMHINHPHHFAAPSYHANYMGYSSTPNYYSTGAGCNNAASAYNALVAQGQYNYLTAMSNLNNQAARAKTIENDQQALKLFYAKRDHYNELQAQAARSRATADELTAQSKAAAPKRLTNLELDSVSGKIYWPAPLLRPEFDANRSELETLFAQRSLSAGEPSGQSCKEIARLTQKLQANLKANIDELTPSEYVSGRRFLNSLQHEARFVPNAQGIAAR